MILGSDRSCRYRLSRFSVVMVLQYGVAFLRPGHHLTCALTFAALATPFVSLFDHCGPQCDVRRAEEEDEARGLGGATGEPGVCAWHSGASSWQTGACFIFASLAQMFTGPNPQKLYAH